VPECIRCGVPLSLESTCVDCRRFQCTCGAELSHHTSHCLVCHRANKDYLSQSERGAIFVSEFDTHVCVDTLDLPEMDL